MGRAKGIIALMGSGELTSTMVEVHKELMARLPRSANAVFLDTPAGFQLNVDQISQRAVHYFRRHVNKTLSVASFKSKKDTSPYEAELAFRALREADFILIGPGSPTFAVKQWWDTPIPEIFIERVEAGGCLVAASAAALTIGRFTLPVYEIYKVGEDVHWAEGLDILGHFGFDVVVVPHWNNAEGGTHDTRFCYMGESRFRELEALLPENVTVIGLDEHTACLLDFSVREAVIKGIGGITLRHQGTEVTFKSGDRFPLDVLLSEQAGSELSWKPSEQQEDSKAAVDGYDKDIFWNRIHADERAFHAGLEKHDAKEVTNALLDLDQLIWMAQRNLEDEEFISQAREILRELIVLLGVKLDSLPKSEIECIAPLVEELVTLRENFRQSKKWHEADSIRDALRRVGIVVEDTREGPRWRAA